MAGRATRAAAHKKKMALKRAAKTAKRALYLSLRGTSKKSKKVNKKRRGDALFNTYSPSKHKHLMLKCGNAGCIRCNITAREAFRKVFHSKFEIPWTA